MYQGVKRLQKQLERVLEVMGTDTTVWQLLIFLEMALNEGHIMTEVVEKLPQEPSLPTVSRTIDILSDRASKRSNRPPLGLIERREVEGDYRKNALYLTKKGRKLCEELA